MGPLDTKLRQFVILSGVLSKTFLNINLVPLKEFLNNLGLHVEAKYKIVGLIQEAQASTLTGGPDILNGLII
jgi:hypothetical protein